MKTLGFTGFCLYLQTVVNMTWLHFFFCRETVKSYQITVIMVSHPHFPSFSASSKHHPDSTAACYEESSEEKGFYISALLGLLSFNRVRSLYTNNCGCRICVCVCVCLSVFHTRSLRSFCSSDELSLNLFFNLYKLLKNLLVLGNVSPESWARQRDG